MKKTLPLSLLMLFVVAAAFPALARGKKDSKSTAPGTYKEWGPDIDEIEILQTFRFGDYNRIVVQPLDTADVALPAKDDNTYERVKVVLAEATDAFVDGLRPDVDARVSIDERGSKSSGVLVIRGKVTTMDPGSKAARYWAGFGAGAARSAIEAEIVDAKSGVVLARFKQERRSGVGAMGGGYRELMNRNLNTIGEDTANLLKMF